jgi:hypothetical protein
MTSLLMKSTSADKDTLHEQDQPLKKLAYVSNHRGPLLAASAVSGNSLFIFLVNVIVCNLANLVHSRF